MLVDCPSCVGGTLEGGGTCPACSGDDEIDLTDTDFKNIRASYKRLLTGVVWDLLLKSHADIESKVNDIMEKVNEIKEVVDEL